MKQTIQDIETDNVDAWSNDIISICFYTLDIAEDPARGSDSELVLKQALTAFYLDYYVKKFEYDSVFPDFDYDLKPYQNKLMLTGNRFKDPAWIIGSYCNDTGPRIDCQITQERCWTVWFDYKNIELSEHREERGKGTMHLFALANEKYEILVSSDNFEDIINYINTHPDFYSIAGE